MMLRWKVSVGAIAAPPLAVWFALHYGWRSAFVFTGAMVHMIEIFRGAHELGIYAAGYAIPAQLLLLTGPMMAAVYPRLSTHGPAGSATLTASIAGVPVTPAFSAARMISRATVGFSRSTIAARTSESARRARSAGFVRIEPTRA